MSERPVIERFEAFLTGITVCYKYIQKIKNAEMTELGLKGTHVACMFYLNHNPEGLTAAQLCTLCAEDKATISRTVADLKSRGYIEAGEDCRTGTPGVYTAGDCRTKGVRQISTACADGATAALAACRYLDK